MTNMIFLLSTLVALSTSAKAENLNFLQPVLQTAICENSDTGAAEKVTAVITDVMRTGFRGVRDVDGTYTDILVTTLGVHRSRANFDDSTISRAITNYNQNNLTDRTYIGHSYTLVVKLPSQLVGTQHVYAAVLTVSTGQKYEMVCRSELNL